MRYKITIWILFICLSASSAFAQLNINQPFPFKNLIFPEVVAGGGLETLVTVSNRGTSTYNGTAYLRKGESAEWNPVVNGTPVTGGQFSVSILPGGMVTYLITGSSLDVGGMVVAADEEEESTAALTSYIEGNLTYFIKSGETTIDSIGVLPATPFEAASLPFDDFNSVTLAFVNSDFEARTANVTMKLYSEDGLLLDTYGPEPILPEEQSASYLYQLFPSVSSLTTGRVEIQSDVPISGIAMMQTASGQFSSLPLGSTIRTYSVITQDSDVIMTRMALWTNGPFVNGYVIVEYMSQQEFVLAFGQVSGEGDNRTLDLHFGTKSELTWYLQAVGFAKTDPGFTWDSTSFSGSFIGWLFEGAIVMEEMTGTFTATLDIP